MIQTTFEICILLLVLIFSLTFLVCFLYYEYSKIGYKGSSYQNQTQLPFYNVCFNKGRYGEYLISKNLKAVESKAHFLFNIYLPKDNGETTEIDVIMVHTSGIYVFESKNYSGWIFGSENEKTWFQTIKDEKHYSKNAFLNPIMQNKLHIKYLTKLLDELPQSDFHPIVTFSDRCTLKKLNLKNPDTVVIYRKDVSSVVNEIMLKSGSILSDEQVESIYNTLKVYTNVTPEQIQKHIDDINLHHSKAAKESIEKPHKCDVTKAPIVSDSQQNTEVIKNPTEPQENKTLNENICPQCGKPLVVRTAKHGEHAGEKFLGCSGFPHCRYTRKIL